MPGTDSQEPANNDMEKLLEEALRHIPTVVHQVCTSLDHYPDQVELKRFAQQVRYMLWEDNYRRLRSFKHQSDLPTWLYKVVKRHIKDQLRKQIRMVSLKDLLPDFFVSQPNQEEKLLNEERERILFAAVRKLTPRKQKLFCLMYQGLKDPEIARRMKISVKSTYVEKSNVLSKLRQLVKREIGEGG